MQSSESEWSRADARSEWNAEPIMERKMNMMLDELEGDLRTRHSERQVRSLVVKMKFVDFRRTTAERAHPEIERAIFKALLVEADSRSEGKPANLTNL